MQRGLTGSFLPIPSPGEECRAFVPHPLPPEPALVLDVTLQLRMERATLALGRLDGLTAVLPDPALFMYSYVRKEAVLSSQICGRCMWHGWRAVAMTTRWNRRCRPDWTNCRGR